MCAQFSLQCTDTIPLLPSVATNSLGDPCTVQPLVRIYLETAADRVFNNHSLRDRLKEISDLIGDELDTRGTRSLTDATWDSVVSAVEEERSIDARRSNFDHRPPRGSYYPRPATLASHILLY